MPDEIAVTQQEQAWVDTVIKDNNALYKERHDIMHRLRKMRMLRGKDTAVGPMQKLLGAGMRVPLGYRLVQNVVGRMNSERPTFTRVPRRPGDKQSAANLANSADPMLQTFEQLSHRPLVLHTYDQLAGDGFAVWKLRRVPWEGYPLREGFDSDKAYNKAVALFVVNAGDQPLRAQLVDPLNFMPSREEWDASYVIEKGRRNIKPFMRQHRLAFGLNNRLERIPEGEPYPELELPSGMRPMEEIIEVWTDEFVYIRLGIRGKKYLKFKNDVTDDGLIPYAWGSGESTAMRDPAADSLSVLFPIGALEPWMNMMMNTMASWAIVGGTPILWTARQAVAGAPMVSQVAVSDIPLGKRIDLGTGGQIGFVTPPPVGREVIEFIQLLEGFIERAGLAPVTEGLIGTRTPGLAFSSALEAATSKLKPLNHSAERILEEVVQKSWKIVEDIGVPIYVNGAGFRKGRGGAGRQRIQGRYVIDPKDIDGYYDIHCKIKMSSLQDLISQGMHAAMMKAHKLWAEDRSMTFAGVEDTESERREIRRDDARKLPVIFMRAVQEAIKEDPNLQRMANDLSEQGVDMAQVLQEAAFGGEGGGDAERVFEGAPQPRGQPAPSAGGKTSGSPTQPKGPRPTKQPRRQRRPK